MFEAVEGLVTEHGELEHRLADPSIHADQGLATAVGGGTRNDLMSLKQDAEARVLAAKKAAQ